MHVTNKEAKRILRTVNFNNGHPVYPVGVQEALERIVVKQLRGLRRKATKRLGFSLAA